MECAESSSTIRPFYDRPSFLVREAGNEDILRFYQFLRASDRVEARIESQSEAIEGKVRK